jgi:hypothetical protein
MQILMQSAGAAEPPLHLVTDEKVSSSTFFVWVGGRSVEFGGWGEGMISDRTLAALPDSVTSTISQPERFFKS